MSNLGEYFTKHHLSAHHKGTIPIYLHCPDIVKSSVRVCYYNPNFKITQGKTIPIGSYINTEAQSKVHNNNVQNTGGVGTNDQPDTLPAKVLKGQQV